eukprot:767470-Hanusia_phi.AAC.6
MRQRICSRKKSSGDNCGLSTHRMRNDDDGHEEASSCLSQQRQRRRGRQQRLTAYTRFKIVCSTMTAEASQNTNVFKVSTVSGRFLSSCG